MRSIDMFELWHGGWHMWWMGASWVIGLLIAVLVMWAVYGTAVQRSNPQEGPEAILKRRYARGEINTEEYNQRLLDLRK
jgi:putative membrane protein